MEQHSKLSPSSAAQWVACPGSVQMQERFPEDGDSQDSLDGKAAHDLAAVALEYRNEGDGINANMIDQINDFYQPSPSIKTVPVTDEILVAVRFYVETVRSVIRSAPMRAVINLLIERRVNIPIIHHECFGTPDAVWYDESRQILHIWDLKFGWGIVEAFRNWQMLCYALGFLDFPFVQVHIHIVQPRAPHLDGRARTWVLSRDELLKLYSPQLQSAAFRAMIPDAALQTGDHCRNCDALHACVPAQQSCLNALEVAGRASSPMIPPEQLGYELMILTRAYEIIKHRKKAVESTALALDRKGTPIPGWTREHNIGKLEWNPGKDEEVRAAAEMFGINVDKPPALLTPTQAITAGMPEDIIKMYSSKKPGSAKLVPTNLDKLALIFGGNNNG